jgi:hypothetical protein
LRRLEFESRKESQILISCPEPDFSLSFLWLTEFECAKIWKAGFNAHSNFEGEEANARAKPTAAGRAQ